MGFFGGGVDLASPSAIGSTTPNTGRFTTLTLAPSANTTPFTASGYSLTGTNAQSLFDLSGTWNTSGTPTAFKLNVTDTASNASSLLMDLQVGGTSRFSITKAGYATLSSYNGVSTGVLGGIQLNSGSTNSLIGYSTQANVFYFSPNNNPFCYNVGNGRFYVNVLQIGGGISNANWAPNSPVFLFQDAGDILAQRNSTNAQTLRLYRTFTDASNYERLGFIATRTTRFAIAAENAGTGAARSLEISFYTSASDPTSTDITSGCFSVWKNSGTGIVKLWTNDGGTMKSIALV